MRTTLGVVLGMAAHLLTMMIVIGLAFEMKLDDGTPVPPEQLASDARAAWLILAGFYALASLAGGLVACGVARGHRVAACSIVAGWAGLTALVNMPGGSAPGGWLASIGVAIVCVVAAMVGVKLWPDTHRVAPG